MKRVLLITRHLRPNAGVGRYSADVATSLVAEGYLPTVLVERGEVSATPVVGVRVLPVLLAPTSAYNVLRNLILSRWHARSFASVHALDGWPYGVYGYAATVGTRKRLFVSALGTYAVAPLAHRYERSLLANAYRRAAAVFCISGYTEARLLKALPTLLNTQVVPLAVHARGPLAAEDRQRLAGRYPEVASHTPVFLTVGEIKERKGQLDTLKGLALLKEQYPNFLYVMIGSAQHAYVDRIRAFVVEHALEDNVLLVTDSRDDSVPSFFYEQCNIFFLNSNNDRDHFEGFGLVILEAAQYGKPSIGSRDCGIEDAIEDGYSGFLTKQGAHDEIAAKVRVLLETPEVFEHKVREHGARYSWHQTAAAYVRAYEV